MTGSGWARPGSNPTLAEVEALMIVVDEGIGAAAHRLGLSEQTVKNHLANLYRRLGVTNRPAAVVALWPVIGRHVLPGIARRRADRRSGRERRAGVPSRRSG